MSDFSLGDGLKTHQKIKFYFIHLFTTPIPELTSSQPVTQSLPKSQTCKYTLSSSVIMHLFPLLFVPVSHTNPRTDGTLTLSY